MQNKYTEVLMKKQIEAQGDIILLAMPDNAVLSRCSSLHDPKKGIVFYSYEGKPFLELHEPTFESVFEDNSYKLKVTQNYRILK